MRWRWAKDGFDSRETSIFKTSILSYDKVQHLFFSMIFTIILYLVGTFFFEPHIVWSPMGSPLTIFLLGILWEVKDALLPYEKVGFWGGDGFSFKDLAADAVGCCIGLLIILIL